MMRHLPSLILAALLLVGCTSWFDTNQPYLAASSNLVPGKRVVANTKTTAYAMAKQHNVSMNDIIVLNRLPSPYVIWPGQEITLPASAQSGRRPYTTRPTYQREPVAPRNNPVTVSELPPVAAVPLAAPPALPQDFEPDEKFLWPVEGVVLVPYGPRNSGGSNDGINIGAPRGTPVVAAANGVVQYASNATRSFGNLVLIRHGNGYITAYAHLDRMVVDPDSVVAKGDMIGTVGNTGSVKGPQLHFEIRKGSKPVDPMPLLSEKPDVSPY